MKRHPHILPRLCALFTLLFAAFRLTAAPVMPIISSEDTSNEHWYYIRFQRAGAGGKVLLGNAGTAGNILKAVAEQGLEANQWKIITAEVDSEGNPISYYLYNKASGLYLGWNSSNYTAVEKANRIQIELKDANTDTNYKDAGYNYPDGWQIHRKDNTSNYKCMNVNGGNTVGNQMSDWNAGDGGNYLEFIAVEPTDYPLYIQFSGYAKRVLQASSSGFTVADATTAEPAAGSGCKWAQVLSPNGTAQYIYKSDNGYYLKTLEATHELTTVAAEATVIQTSANSYMQAVSRLNLLTTNGKSMSYNAENNTVYWGDPNTRYSCINITSSLNSPDTAPLPDNNYVVGFPAVYKILGGDGLDSHYLRWNEDDTKNATNIWMIEEDATGRIRLKNHNGFYVYNRENEPGTASFCGYGGRFYLTDNPNVATWFYLEEHSNQPTCWQLRDSQPYGTSSFYYLGPDAVSASDDNVRHQMANAASNRVSFTPYTGAVTPAGNYYSYLQFTGYGKALLTDNGADNALTVTATTETTPTGDGLLWKQTHTDALDYVYVSKLGNYLYLDATNLKTVADKTNATALSKTTNSYSRPETATRYNLQNGTESDSPALSYNGTTLSLGSPNTRYSLINFVTTLSTPDTAPLPGHYYNVKFPSLSKKMGGDGIDSKDLKIESSVTANTTNVWQIVEESNGQFKLQNKNGYYLYNRLTNPGTDADCGNGGRYYLTDNAALASPFYLEEHSAGGYWQLRDPHANGGLLYLNPNQSGDGNTIRHWTANDPHSKVLFEINDVEVPTVGSTAENAYFYLQFSAFGKRLLTDNGAGNALTVTKVSEETPADNGYLWRMHHLMGSKGVTDGVIVCISKKGNYLNLSGATPISDVEANATPISFSANDYNGSVTPRYNLTRADGTALCFDGTSLSMGTSNARFSVIHRCTTVTGPDYFPLISTDDATEEHWYSFKWAYMNKVLDAKIPSTTTQFSASLQPTTSNTWKLVDDGSGNGKYYFKNMNGLYLRNDASVGSGGRYVTTTNIADATALRIVEFEEGDNRGYWQLRNTSSTGKQYLNPSGGASAKYLEHWNANDGVNKVLFEPVENTPTVNKYFYMYFSALGQLGLYDPNAPNVAPKAQKPNLNTDDAAGYVWFFENVTGNELFLRSQLGNYLTWTDAGKFGLSNDPANAIHLTLQANSYENNQNQRCQLLKADDNSKALCVDYATGMLRWGQKNDRYSVLWLDAPIIAGPDLPVISTSSSSFTLHHIILRVTGETLSDEGAGTKVVPVTHSNDLSTLSSGWSFKVYTDNDGNKNGDVYIISGKGNYLMWDATNNYFTTSPVLTETSPTRFRIIENDQKRNSWQLQLPDYGNKMLRLAYTDEAAGTDPYFTIEAPNHNRNYLIFEILNIEPDFATETSGAWNFITFVRRDAQEKLSSSKTSSSTVGITTTPDRRYSSWKLIGTAESFILKNGNDTYLKVNTDGTVELTADATEASKLKAHYDVFASSMPGVDWIVEVLGLTNEAGKALYLKYDATLDATTDGIIDGLTTGTWPTGTDNDFYDYGMNFDLKVSPKYSDSNHSTYYRIWFKNSNLYLSDGYEKTADAYAETLNEAINGQRWLFIGDKDASRLQNMNGLYLMWNAGNQTFDVTTDAALAAVFNMRKGTSSGTNPAGYFELIGGADDAYLGQYMTVELKDGLYHVVLTSTVEPETGLTEAILVEENTWEDYSQYAIRPKRSWLVKQATDLDASTMVGFISPDKTTEVDPSKLYGFTTGMNNVLQQNTNTYHIVRYLKPGTMRQLFLPTTQREKPDVSSTRVRAYQRWYDYEHNTCIDPKLVSFDGYASRRNYANGTVMGESLLLNNQNAGDYVHGYMEFHMPKVSEKDAEGNYKAYYIGLDGSQYTDFVDYFGDNGNLPYSGVVSSQILLPENQDLIEPTLSGRYLFEIRNAHEIAQKLMQCTEGSDKWLEEINITLPTKKRGFYPTCIPLSNEFGNYWFYQNEIVSDETLQNISTYNDIRFKRLDTDTSVPGYVELGGLGLTDWPVEGTPVEMTAATAANEDISTRRFLRIYYPGEAKTWTTSGGTKIYGNYGYGEVTTNNATATIGVYARANGSAGEEGADDILYQVAKITLTFVENAEPRPYTELIGTTSARDPQNLRKRVGEPVAEINFDPNTFHTYLTPPVGTSTLLTVYQGSYAASTEFPVSYKFPLLYENSSYTFQPVSGNLTAGTMIEHTWGAYSVNRRLQLSTGGNFKPMKNYYKELLPDATIDDSQAGLMYIDASDLPGKIASLEFSSNLCSGSRTYASAWIASPNVPEQQNQTNSKNNVCPANVIFHVVGHTSRDEKLDQPQTLHTYAPGPIYMKGRTDMTASNTDGIVFNGNGNNDRGMWQQVFFSFVNDSKQQFAYYTLDIDNACTSSIGGDILIDDVEVFVSKPTVTVEKTSPVCGKEVTLTKMTTDFDDLMLSLGLEENTKPASGNPRLWFCLLDKKLFDHKVDSLTLVRSGGEGISSSEWQQLFNATLVGDPNSSKEEDKAFRWVEVSTFYDKIETFNYAKALATNKAIVQREEDAGGNRYIVISDKVNSDRLLPRHDYYIVFVPRYGDDPITAANSAEQFQISSNCCIKNSFTTTSAVQILGDTEHAADGGNELEVCAGQNVNLTVQIKGTDKNTGDLTTVQTYYDWWLDFKGGAFENMYINADGTLSKNAKPEPTDASQVSLSEALINMRHYYPKAISIEGLTPRHDADQPVELTQQMLNGLKAALTPESDGIPRLFLYRISLNVQIPSTYSEGEKSRIVTVVPIEFTNENIIYCFDPQHIVMSISGNAPRMLSGLANTTYPNDNFNAPVRTALDRTEQATELTAGTQPATLFRLPLHGLKGTSSSANELIPFQLEATTPGDPAYTPVYIAGTNDPACQVYTTNAEGDMLMREVGRVVNLEALVKNQPDPYQPYADFYFLKDFTPREGYTYQLRFEYKEDPAEPAESGKPICNGAVCFDLKIVPQYLMWKAYAGNTDWNNDGNWKRADKDELNKTASDTYPVNNAMAADPQQLQTDNGFVPIEGCHVVIAPADYEPQLSGALNEASATKDIQYDMVMKATPVDNCLNCEAFYLNTCEDVLLQTGGELINAQHLKYNKAWMEYELAAGRWYTLGSPMQQMYAGDWFAPTQGGRQLTPYFEGITFNTTDYNRFSPAVYQRGWDKGTATLYYLSDLSNEASTANSQNVAVMAMWSSVYNDVQETYGNGGFSLKTLAASKSGTPYSNLLFRLPKEDTSYKYYKDNVTPGTGGNEQGIDERNITYKLLTDKLSSAPEFTRTITNNVAGNQYFLVGNPFPCGLDMTQFFNGDSTLIEQKYWLLTADGQASAMKTEAGWITINTSSGTTPDVLAPGQGFFVKAKGTSGTLKLKFTAAMMASARGYNAVLRAPARRSTAASCPTLRMRTETEAGSSEAVIVKLAEASNDYAAAEDMLTLLDDNLKDVPTVYSLADHQALTVNTRRTMQRVPVGITGGTDGPVQVVFSGLETFGESLSLLDDLTGVVTPLTLNAKPLPGVNELAATVDMQANVANRYFLLSSATPEAEEELTDVKPLVIVNGQKVNITTNATYPLTYVHIVDAEGRTVYTLTPYTPTLSLKLPMGNYVVEARTATQAVTTKVNIAQ